MKTQIEVLKGIAKAIKELDKITTNRQPYNLVIVLKNNYKLSY